MAASAAQARATTAVPRPVPEMQENPIDDWDTMLGRSQVDRWVGKDGLWVW